MLYPLPILAATRHVPVGVFRSTILAIVTWSSIEAVEHANEESNELEMKFLKHTVPQVTFGCYPAIVCSVGSRPPRFLPF